MGRRASGARAARGSPGTPASRWRRASGVRAAPDAPRGAANAGAAGPARLPAEVAEVAGRRMKTPSAWCAAKSGEGVGREAERREGPAEGYL